MARFDICEKYSWLTPEMAVTDSTGKSILIRGQALYSFEKFPSLGISKNGRKYVEEALLRAAQSFVPGTPIDVNHQLTTWQAQGKKGREPKTVGHLEGGYYEDGAVEYVAKLKDPEYVGKAKDTVAVRKGQMTREAYRGKWGKDPLAGVSVDANFLWMRCVNCGAKFYDGDVYKRHMWESHSVPEHAITVEPHGIYFKALSLVEPPEQPGVNSAGFEIVETVQPMARLWESVIRDIEGRLDYMAKLPAAVSNESPTVLVDGRKKPEVAATAEAAEKAPQPVAPKTREEADAPKPPDKSVIEKMSIAQIKAKIDELSKQLDSGEATEVPKVASALENSKWRKREQLQIELRAYQDALRELIKMDAMYGMDGGSETKISIPKIEGFQSPEALVKLTLGEPFAGYMDMADCVEKNRDKEGIGDPEAYCATIMRKAEGKETTPPKLTLEVSDKSIEELKHEKAHEDIRQSVRVTREVMRGYAGDLAKTGKALEMASAHDKALTGGYNSLVETVNKLSTSITSIVEQFNKALGVIPDYAPAIRGLESKIAAIPDRAAEIKALQDNVNALPDHGPAIKTLETRFEALRESVEELNANLGERVKTWGESLEQLNKKYVEFKEAQETEKRELKETTDAEKRVKDDEIKGLKEEVQRLKTLTENVEEKVNKRGQFKGVHRAEGSKAEDEDYEPFPVSGRKPEAK